MDVTTGARRHRTRAALFSAVCIGLGQLYNKQYMKGLLWMIAAQLFFWTYYPIAYEGIRGLITLGDVPTQVVSGQVIKGDHSIFLLIEGLITLVLVLLFAGFYVLNIYDAKKNGALRDEGRLAPGFIESAKQMKLRHFPYLLLLPSICFVLFVTVVPLVFNVLIAFTNYSAPNHIPDRNLVNWTGLSTFYELFAQEAWRTTFFGISVWNVIWAGASTLSVFFSGLLLALMVNHPRVKFKKFWRTIFILPWAIPQFISILVFRVLLNGSFGPVNDMITKLGFAPVPWLSDPTMAKFTILLVNLWFSTPFLMALMSGVLTTMPRDLYEAASVDGATGTQKFFKLTLPLVLAATAPLLIMQFAFNFNNFNLIYMLTDGNPNHPDYYYAGSTDILISWIFKMTLNQSQFNMASAVSIIMFVFITVFSLWNYRRMKITQEEDMV
ncbi:ABC transporter permease subunit [Paenibacillus thiaminolyticus]|uniref:Maltose/maltodextrin transport system permease protein n=1 Tax=Paenibacillus thiaminolyticus TaxID=49283 RepID=A0AAP9DSX4_PANTH|nr:sugar ABC transporter permease [Paenibacillus thiaminolyticus]MCY9538123.1 ABC transporter permease subunit [Paenibacillus thiaminolyticus]MCY9600924.1 ABC transporter permease subunit [Paenibacillus thiaminolyticus]MCY9606057.1 ABC transporter permease subunit [Paenibacillus thiaminolyticus]MCY9614609.1 ABC transporter permease subunit [Paenibacillus thiaminolyticus]MCY9617772.1 ABC transporter permease subunit [Paenibacillus thiaminolyticus]